MRKLIVRSHTTSTVVIFRKEKSGKFKGDITAVFPYECYSHKGLMLCYAHVGQHSDCSYDWYISNTLPAKPEEYAPLLKELQDIGYKNLVIRQKINSNLRRIAAKEYNKI